MPINVDEFMRHLEITRIYCPPEMGDYYMLYTLYHSLGWLNLEAWLYYTIFLLRDYPFVVLALNSVLNPEIRIGIFDGCYFRVLVDEDHIWIYFFEGQERRRWLGVVY